MVLVRNKGNGKKAEGMLWGSQREHFPKKESSRQVKQNDDYSSSHLGSSLETVGKTPRTTKTDSHLPPEKLGKETNHVKRGHKLGETRLLDLFHHHAPLPSQDEPDGKVEREQVGLEGNRQEDVPEDCDRVTLPQLNALDHMAVLDVCIHLAEEIDGGKKDRTQAQEEGTTGVQLHRPRPIASNGRQAWDNQEDAREPDPFPEEWLWDVELFQFQDENVETVEDVLNQLGTHHQGQQEVK